MRTIFMSNFASSLSSAAILLVTGAVCAASPPLAPAPSVASHTLESSIRPFLQSNCFDCHGDTEQKSGLRLDTLALDFSKPSIQQTWIEVFDKVSTGEIDR